jgi:hypothetical protein
MSETGDFAYDGSMGETHDRCLECGHLLLSHETGTGCTERVPGTMARMPGTCDCGSPEVLADVIPFRTRSERDAARGMGPSSEAPA